MIFDFLKKVFVAIFFSFHAFAAVDLSQLPPPYNTVSKLLPFNDHGWYVNAPQMERMIRSRSIRTVIEIGSWMGLSTRHMARLLPIDGKVYAVDHWLGSSEHRGIPEFARYIPTLYEQFLSNVIHTRLVNKIVPVRMDSLDAAKTLTHIKPDLIYLDAGHEVDNVYRDLEAWFPYVSDKKGVFCGDDWMWPSVRAAVERFAEDYNLKLHVDQNFWWFEE